jgi:hypothetical protein
VPVQLAQVLLLTFGWVLGTNPLAPDHSSAVLCGTMIEAALLLVTTRQVA